MKSNVFAVTVAASLLIMGVPVSAQEVKPVAPADASSLQSKDAEKTITEGTGLKADGQLSSVIEKHNAIIDSIVVGERPFYNGSGLYALGGLVGGLVASAAWKDEPDRIAGFVRQEGVDIGSIVSSEFHRQLEESAEAKQAISKNDSAKFKMEIVYGITSVPFSSDYRPYLSVRMKLVDSNGVEKWKDREYVGRNGKAKSLPYPDFFKSAKDFINEYEVAATEVVSLLMSNLARGI